jgi:hypothetical protein
MGPRRRRKLSLSKETVRRLNLEPVADGDLGAAVGGGAQTRTCLDTINGCMATIESYCNPCITHTCQ